MKKLFSDEESDETSAPTNPRRPNILHSSSFDDPLRLTSNLPTKDQYQTDISNIDDYENEERRRRVERQNQVKMSDIAAQSKKATARKKTAINIEVEPEFDGSEYISTPKIVGKRTKVNESDKFKSQQPRQPKKERSLTSQVNEVKFSQRIHFFSFYFISSLLIRMNLVVIHQLRDFYQIFKKQIMFKIY